LEALYLTDNRLTELPREFRGLTRLRRIYLRGNPLRQPYPALIRKSPYETARNVIIYSATGQVPADTPPGDGAPEVPSPGPGSTFVITPAGFELASGTPEQAEQEDNSQQALLRRIVRRVERLREPMRQLSNTHPALAEEFADYDSLLSHKISELDVPSLWSCGSGLIEFVRALDAQVSAATLTPLIEPEPLADLRALIHDHAAFILGFEKGRELASRVAALHNLERTPEQLRDMALRVLRPMLEGRHLLAQQAQRLVRALVRAFEDGDAKGFALLTAGFETGKNGIIAFGRALHPVLLAAGAVDIARALLGDASADTLRAATVYLRDNAEPLIGLAASDPQLSIWLEWLISRMGDQSGSAKE